MTSLDLQGPEGEECRDGYLIRPRTNQDMLDATTTNAAEEEEDGTNETSIPRKSRFCRRPPRLVVVAGLLLLSLLHASVGVAEAVCLRPRLDLRSKDDGFYATSKGDKNYKGVVSISCLPLESSSSGVLTCTVARNRHGIYRLEYADVSNASTEVQVQPLGDPFGYDIMWVALADQGKVVAVSNTDHYVSVLHATNSTLALELTQVVAKSTKDSFPEGMWSSTGGLALNGNGTVLATSVLQTMEPDFIGLFPVSDGMKEKEIDDDGEEEYDAGGDDATLDTASNIANTDDNSTNLLYAQPIERITAQSAEVLVLAATGEVLIAANGACAANPLEGDKDDSHRDMAHLRIYRRSEQYTSLTLGYDWELELDLWGASQPCDRWAYTGISVATNQDGSLVAIGAFNTNATNDTITTPSVSVFEYQPSEHDWILRDSIDTGNNNRTLVSLSGDGTWLALGTPLWNVTNTSGLDLVQLLQYDADQSTWEVAARIPATNNEIVFPSLGNGIAINEDATILAVGHSGIQLLLYDIVHSNDDNGDLSDCTSNVDLQQLQIYPSDPDTSDLCEANSITMHTSNPVFHLGLSGTVVALEDSKGLEGKDTSKVRFMDVSDWILTPIDMNSTEENDFMAEENATATTNNNTNTTASDNLPPFTSIHHQDAIISAHGTMAAILSKGNTEEDPDVIRVFRLSNNNGARRRQTEERIDVDEDADHIFHLRQKDGAIAEDDDDHSSKGYYHAQEISSIQGGKFEAAIRGIAFSGDGTVIVASGYTLDREGKRSNHTVQAHTLASEDEDHDSDGSLLLDDAYAHWVPLGSSISVTSPFGQHALSSNKSDLVLVIGDSLVGESQEGQVRIFKLQQQGNSPSDWELQAEFMGTTDQDQNLGFSASINADGNLVAVGALLGRDSYGMPNVGAIKVYHNNDNNVGWSLRDRFSVGNRNDAFGYSLALSKDGNRIAVGTMLPYPSRSKVRLLEYDEALGRWVIVFADKGYSVTATGGDVTVERFSFGQSVALNEDGSLLATGSGSLGLRVPYSSTSVGSPWEDHVRVYNLSSCLATRIYYTFYITEANATNGTETESTNTPTMTPSMVPDQVIIVSSDASFPATQVGAITMFVRIGFVWALSILIISQVF